MKAWVMAVLAVPLWAQWNYPTAGIPRTADGKPDLSAPAPRTADGKPDFSGTWDVEHNKPCPPEGCVDFFVPQEFGKIGWGLKGDLPYRPWAQELAKTRAAALRLEDPLSHCLPIGVVESHTIPLFRKIVQVPGLLLILSEYNVSYRQIFTDGRALPCRSAAVVERLFDGEVGRRHAGGEEQRLSRWDLARFRRRSDYRCRYDY